MNPLSTSSKGLIRLLAVLVAAGTLIFALGCGSGGNNGGGGGGGGSQGFTNASLNGRYAFSQKGISLVQGGGSSDVFSEGGVFTADGSGHLSNIIDEFAQSGQVFTTFDSPLTGAYQINSDGTGLLTFNFGGGVTSNFRIAFVDSSHFYLIEQDFFATGAGSGEKQDSSAFSASPSGDFVFGSHDLWFATSRVGRMSLSAGAIDANEDLLQFGSSSINTNFTGTITPPDINGRGQVSLSDGSTFFYYVVNSSKFRFLTSSGSLELGVAEKQTGGPFSVATLASGNSFVFGTAGDTSVVSGIHSAGVFTTDGNGLVTGGATDYVLEGAIFADVAVNNTSDYILDTDGRGVMNLDLANGGAQQNIFWMVNPTRAYFLVNSSSGLEDGTFTKQQGAPFTNASLNKQAALFMDGFDVAFKDRVGTLEPDGNGNFTWHHQALSYDSNVVINPGVGSSFSTTGTYQVGSNGRVTATVKGLINGDSSMVFYLTSPNAGYMLQEDQGFDIGGAFTQQVGP